jgi:asparagine synthase (glutamine-hydrolysing)
VCGIAGIIFFQSRPRESIVSILEAMNRAQAYRGPDGQGLWTDGRVGLAHVRLALVGDAQRGQEPLADEAGAQLVFNGEIYHPARLMARLGAEFPDGETDARALHTLLDREGPDGLAGVEGPFAAARYRPGAGKVLFVRDAWGKKPLYLHRTQDALYFASTVAALRAAIGPFQIRTEALFEYLVYRSVGGYRSAFQGVEQLRPGSWLEVALDGTERGGVWFSAPNPDRDNLEAEEVRDTVDHAVEQRLDPSQEQGVFLSGGLDSCIVAESATRQAGPSSKFRLYSIGYDVPGQQDERNYARRMAETLPHPYEEITLRAADVPALFEQVGRFLEDPIQDPVTLPTLRLCQAASRYSRCALTGDGSDEFWGGYERFDNPPEQLDDYWPRTAVFEPKELGLCSAPKSYLDQVDLPPTDWPALDRILAAESRNRLRNYHLARIDKLGMACALEIRSPFLDRRVTTLAQQTPARLKRPGGRPKGLLIEAFRAQLPTWLVARKKQPFSVPIKQWLEGELKDYARDRLSSASRTASLRPATPYFEDLNDKNAAKVWSLLALEAWMEQYS